MLVSDQLPGPSSIHLRSFVLWEGAFHPTHRADLPGYGFVLLNSDVSKGGHLDSGVLNLNKAGIIPNALAAVADNAPVVYDDPGEFFVAGRKDGANAVQQPLRQSRVGFMGRLLRCLSKSPSRKMPVF